MLQLDISSITDEGKHLSFSKPESEFGELQKMVDRGEIAKGFIVEGNCFIQKTGTTIIAKGSAKTEISLQCSRCLKNYSHKISSDFEYMVVPEPHDTNYGEEKELSGDEMDISYYKDNIIDIGHEVESQIILSIPLKPLCMEDCKGLCPNCGTDLNIEECVCKTEKGHEGFKKLADLKISKIKGE